jgi:hypothetical protein
MFFGVRNGDLNSCQRLSGLRSTSIGQSLTGTDRRKSFAFEEGFLAIQHGLPANTLANFQQVYGL